MGRASKVWIRAVLASILVSAAVAAAAGPYGEGSEKYGKAPAEATAGPQEAPAAAEAAAPATAPAPKTAAWTGAPAIVKVTPAAATVGRYRTLSVAIELNTPYNNPFDQEDIKVDMLVTGPAGEAMVQPCFFKGGNTGSSQWEARFAPRKTGEYGYRISVTRQGATEQGDAFKVQSEESGLNGFLRMDPDSWYGLRHDNGKRFRGVGENFGWEGGKYTFRNTLPLLKQNKVNFIRTWEGPGRFGLEHNQSFNRYSLAVADKIDTVMQLAEENGVHVMAALDPHIYYATKPDYWAPGIIRWNENPYSQGKGGPCARPADFFTNARAKAAYKNRLRYAVARWGSNTHLAVWEFWNEVDHLVSGEGVTTAMLGAWHQEMAAYLRSIDPYGHIITTSLSHNDYREIWNLAGIEFTQRHLYGSSDGMGGTFSQYESNYRKPFVSGEFSLHWTGTTATSPAAYERELHMALWRGMFQQTPILPMTWWWDFHADQGDYFHFACARDMVEKMVEGDGKLERAAFTAGGELEVLAGKTPLGAYLWARNKQGGTVSAPAVTLTGIPDLTYDVRTLDTWTGTWGQPQALSASGGSLRVTLPSLGSDKDIAVWLQARLPVAARGGASGAPGLNLSAVRQEGGRLILSLASPGGPPLTLILATLDGRTVFRSLLPADRASAGLTHTVDLPGLRGGVYVLSLEQAGATWRRPLAIR